MDRVTQQNAAMVEETTAASHSLASEAESLATSVSRFKVGEGQEPAAAAAAPARSPSRGESFAGRYAQAPRASARDGSAARKLEPAADAEGWEEF